jgi:hypothetical protein
MGVIYKARQVSLNRIVAVKMILAGHLASETDVKRFRTEAEAAANLQHPNIVAIHEVGEHDGQHYFSMDYVEGMNLAELVRSGTAPAGRAAQWLKTIAEAIHYAHQRGTLHRDLKPHNVIIGPDDQPRITDFGLAKRVEEDSGLTRSGAVLGSPSYMAPEQAGGRQDQVGPASDVYSLGAILYELMTGRPPFRGPTPAATLMAVLSDPVIPPSKVNPRTPRDLETICLKCLEKRPERRYATARQLAEELGRFLNHEPILARPASALRRTWSWAQRHPWVLAGVAAVLLLGLAGLAFGFWEQTRYLAWNMAHPGQPIKAQDDLLLTTSWFGFSFFGGGMVLAAPWFATYYRRLRDAGQRVPPGSLLAYAGLGALFLAYAAVLSVKTIRVLVWEQNPSVIGLFWGIAFLVWSGLLILWQAVGVHESSAYLHAVERSIERQYEKRSRRTWIDPRSRIMMLLVFAFCLWISLGFGVGLLGGLVLESKNRAYYLAGATIWIATWVWLRWVRKLRAGRRLGLIAVGSMVLGGTACLAYARWGGDALAPVVFAACSALTAAGALSLHRLGKRPAGEPVEERRTAKPVPPQPIGRLGRGYLIGVAATALLCITFGLDALWGVRARTTLNHLKGELAGKGISLDLQTMVAAPVRVEQNFAKTPLIEAIGYYGRVDSNVWRHLRSIGIGTPSQLGNLALGQRVDLKDMADMKARAQTNQAGGVLPSARPDQAPAAAVLAALEPVETQLAELRQARHRPHAFLDPPEVGTGRSTPNGLAFHLLAELFRIHAAASLAMGRGDVAAEDFRTLHRLADALRENQPVHGTMVRIGILGSSLQIVWEGLVDRRWSQAQLFEFQDALQTVDCLRDLDRGFLRDFTMHHEWYERGEFMEPRFMPFGELVFGTQRTRNAYLQLFEPLSTMGYDVRRQRVYPAGAAEAMRALRRRTEEASLFGRLFLQWFPNPAKALPSVARRQTFVNLTVLACALERYRFAQGGYPPSLAELAPRFLARIPHDLLTGQTLKYRRTDDTQFLLYSVGWDQVDDGGKDAPWPEAASGGDWVWHTAATSK